MLKAKLSEVKKTVYHIRFGKGEIISCNDNQIAILFDAGEKVFDLDTVVYNGYLNLSDWNSNATPSGSECEIKGL